MKIIGTAYMHPVIPILCSSYILDVYSCGYCDLNYTRFTIATVKLFGLSMTYEFLSQGLQIFIIMIVYGGSKILVYLYMKDQWWIVKYLSEINTYFP